jgi:glycerate 2-kinase
MSASQIVLDQLHADASAIYAQALKACNVTAAFDRHIRFEGKTLLYRPSPQAEPMAVPLEDYKRVVIIAFGKAALTMSDTLLERLPHKPHLASAVLRRRPSAAQR